MKRYDEHFKEESIGLVLNLGGTASNFGWSGCAGC